MTQANGTSRAASAIFRNADEQEERELKVEGNLPEWLEGVLYRTGPGRYSSNSSKTNKEGNNPHSFEISHWFDGKALNHRFRISGKEGIVLYRSRFACSDQMAKEDREGRCSTVTFAQPYDPCERLYTKFKSAFHTLANTQKPESASDANVNVVIRYDHQNNVLMTSSDNPTLQKLDPTTLEPIQILSYQDFDPNLAGHLSGAHPAIIDGTRYNYILKFGPIPTYKIFSLDDNGKCKILHTIYDAPSAYLHSMAVTETYVVLTIWQADITNLGLGIPLKNNVVENVAKWNPRRKTVHYIINRQSGKLVRKIKSDPFFCFHHINAYENDDASRIVLDLATYEDTTILDAFRMELLRNFDVDKLPRTQYRRVVLDVSKSEGSNGSLIHSRPPREQFGVELPTINPLKAWRKARYCYGTYHTRRAETQNHFIDSVMKLDLDDEALDQKANTIADAQKHKIWFTPNMIPSEAIFVPRPDCVEEDDGVLLIVALNTLTESSELVVLDAKTMKQIVSAKLDCVFPIGFHGTFAKGID
ncbi:carotenoid oxygenase [Meira miltonrushii]|uniref:Carotenoid oxygenase n=1 Tax=Meira miltonrushii TaxID=1280837 RepID=A0A316V7U1_9BASI|nr:carotenoid oxygenase [Meira miltonrushii]PWN31515.1 carotenoid oxygenase [Meira miltonrushii]